MIYRCHLRVYFAIGHLVYIRGTGDARRTPTTTMTTITTTRTRGNLFSVRTITVTVLRYLDEVSRESSARNESSSLSGGDLPRGRRYASRRDARGGGGAFLPVLLSFRALVRNQRATSPIPGCLSSNIHPLLPLPFRSRKGRSRPIPVWRRSRQSSSSSSSSYLPLIPRLFLSPSRHERILLDIARDR